MTSAEDAGDNPLRLANEIHAALAKYGLGNDHRMCKAIHFFERELRLIAECLRCAGPQKVTRAAAPGSTRGVATREEIEKYLEQLKRTKGRRVIDAGRPLRLPPTPSTITLRLDESMSPSPPAEKATARQ